MESEDQFYLTLPSSASMDLHPNNKISDFTTELLNTLYLEREKYEVGLSEIILDADIENITETKLAFTIYRGEDSVENELKINDLLGVKYVRRRNNKYYYERFLITQGKYSSLSSMFRHFNTKFSRSKICKDLIFLVHSTNDDENEIVTFRSLLGVNMKDVNSFIWQREDWFRKCHYLRNNEFYQETDLREIQSELKRHVPGMSEYIDRNEIIKNEHDKSYHFACNKSELLSDPGMAYVYTDIVHYQHVGNTKAPLLRVVHFPANQRCITFPHINYLTLAKPCLSSIHLYIRDVNGDNYPFARGTALIRIHVRKKHL